VRRSFVSLPPDSDVPLEDVSRLVCHNSSQATEPPTASRSGLFCCPAPRRWTVFSGGPL